MKHIASGLAGAAVALLLAACAGGSASAPEQAQQGRLPARAESTQVVAAAQSISAPRLEASGLLAGRSTSFAAQMVAALPPLPMPGRGDTPTRRVSAEQEITVYGRERISASADATQIGDSLDLAAPAGKLSWAIFQCPSFDAVTKKIVRLRAHVSSMNFTGEAGGYWLAVSDYEHQRWDILNQTVLDTYSHALAKTPSLISPAGNMYIAVLLYDAQDMRVEYVQQVLDDIPLTWHVVDIGENTDHGYYPAAAISLSGVPMVAYERKDDGGAYFIQPDPQSDFNSSSDWTGRQGLMYPVEPVPAKWIDMVVDPLGGFPRACILFDETHVSSGKNTTLALTALRQNGQGQFEWLALPLAGVDDGEYASIAYNPVTSKFGIAVAAKNSHSAGAGEYDLERREFDVQQLLDGQNIEIQLQKAFGTGLRYPHLRYSLSGRETYAVAGGHLIYEDPEGSYIFIYEENDTEPWGSTAYVPVNAESQTVLGNSYALNSASGGQLFYGNFDSSLIGNPEQVDEVSGAGSWIGGVSQLEFQIDGTPCIAYTWSDGSQTGIRYAFFKNSAWQVEDVNTEPIAVDADHQDVKLDLAVEPDNSFVAPTGRVIIAFTQDNGASAELRVAIRQPGA